MLFKTEWSFTTTPAYTFIVCAGKIILPAYEFLQVKIKQITCALCVRSVCGVKLGGVYWDKAGSCKGLVF
jgi:hypothetical protein